MVTNTKKWLFLDPMFVAAIAFLGYFNYIFDKMFRELVLSSPQLAIPYMFQYNFILPVIDIVLLLIVLSSLSFLKSEGKESVST